MSALVAFDSETHLLKPGLLAPPPVCFSFHDPNHSDAVLLDKKNGARSLEFYMDRGDILIGANVAYDFAVLCAYREDLIPKVFKHYEAGLARDVQIRQKLLDIAAGCLNAPRHDGTSGYSLADLELHWLKRDRSKEKQDPNGWRMRYAELDGVPIPEWPQEARTYAMEDATGALQVYLAQGKEVVDEIPQTCAAWALHLMACRGLITEKQAVDALEKNLLAQREKNNRWLHKAGFFKTRRATKAEVYKGEADIWEETKKGLRPLKYVRDMGRIQATVEKYFKRRGRATPVTNTGRVATDKDTLEQTGSRILQLLADGGGVEKILTTYIPALRQGTEVPITSRPNVLVASGRTSWSSPNLQNMPTGKRVGGVRNCFIPRPGFLYITADYGSAELRAQAQNNIRLFGRSKLADLFKEKRDPLSEFASWLIGCTYEQIEAGKKIKGSREKKARDMAKVGIYGMAGGLGADSLREFARAMYGIVMSKEESLKLRADYFHFLPEMKAYLDKVGRLTGSGSTRVVSFVSGRVRGDVTYTQAANHFFQALVADGAKAAMFRIAYESYVDCGTALFGSRPVAFVHDEFILESPEDIAPEACERLVEVMCSEMSKYMPDVPITAEPTIMDRWVKEAGEKRDANGRLVVWSP